MAKLEYYLLASRNKVCPCKECDHRKIGFEDGKVTNCHTDCEDYLSWKDKVNKSKNEIYNKKIEQSKLDGYICESVNKSKGQPKKKEGARRFR